MGPTDHHALPYIRSLLARAGTQLSGPAPVQLELCTNLQQGVTNCPAYCPGRHALDPTLDLAPPSDRPHNLEPELEFRVLAVESPVCYWVRLADPAWPACWARLTVRLARHSTTRPAPVPAAKLEDGWSDLVAVWSATGHLHRAKVMTRAGREEEGWKVWLLDSAETWTVPASSITPLPPSCSLSVCPAGAVQVVVAGWRPVLKDPDWSPQCTASVASYLAPTRQLRPLRTRGTVLLHTRHTVWLDRCHLLAWQPRARCWTITFSTGTWLEREGWAEPHPAHKQLLLKLATQAGIPRPSRPETSSTLTDDASGLVEGGWVEVCMSECLSPSEFYLQPRSRLLGLAAATREAVSWAETQNQLGCSEVNVGDLVLARLENGADWERAKVEKTGLDQVLVRGVDTGLAAYLHPGVLLACPAHLASLPHTALRCRLAGLQTVLDAGEDEAGNLLFSMTRDEADRAAVVLACAVAGPGQDRSVEVELWHPQQNRDLAALLVEAGLASRVGPLQLLPSPHLAGTGPPFQDPDQKLLVPSLDNGEARMENKPSHPGQVKEQVLTSVPRPQPIPARTLELPGLATVNCESISDTEASFEQEVSGVKIERAMPEMVYDLLEEDEVPSSESEAEADGEGL